MIHKNAFSSLFWYLIIVVLLSNFSFVYFYWCNSYRFILYVNQQVPTNHLVDDYKASSTKLNFLIDKDYWDFDLNSILQFKIEADVSLDIKSLIQNNAEVLKKVYKPQIPLSDQVKYFGSMLAVGVKMNISMNKTLTLIFSRLWYSGTVCHGTCTRGISYVYVEAFTSDYRKISYNLKLKNGKLLKIPSILNITAPELNSCCLGPEDSRIVLDENNQLFLVFNMKDKDKRRKMWLYDISTGNQAPFSLENNSFSAVEKNWSPFFKDNKLYLIYSYNPLKILQCSTTTSVCEFISGTESSKKVGALRGGTQFIRYRNSDYYVSIARTQIFCNKCRGFYRPHLIVLSTKSTKFHLVYVSEPLMLDRIPMFASYFMSKIKNPRTFCGKFIRIMTPGAIIDWKWSEDKLTFTISIDDKKAYIVSVVGIGHVVQNIISAIQTKYSQVFFNDILVRKMVSRSETIAQSYCKSTSNRANWIVEKFKASNHYSKEKIIKTIIDSPTYPTFRAASNTNNETLNSWIKNDYVNFGLIGRYLIEYESVHGHQSPGTHLMVDAGGNHGTYALYSAALNQSVLVFEILADYWIIIQESIRINPKFNERMILYPFGVSDKYQAWKVLPQAEMTRLDFIKSKTSKTQDQKSWNDLTIAQAYPLDDFIFRKISVMKIDVAGFEIRALKGATQIIRRWGVGAILIEIAAKRWSWNNITLDEGISVLKQVTSMGNYLCYVIARNDGDCPASQISKLHGIIETKSLFMINMQHGTYEVAPQIFRLTEWTTMIMHMKDNDWSCNFWFESALK